jgi:transposase-like protein
MSEDTTNLGKVIRIDDERVRDYLRNVVRGSVEETLNAMLEAEAERWCNAGRYERTEARRDTPAGSYQARDAGRGGRAQGAEVAPADLRDRHHRALPATGKLGRRG